MPCKNTGSADAVKLRTEGVIGFDLFAVIVIFYCIGLDKKSTDVEFEANYRSAKKTNPDVNLMMCAAFICIRRRREKSAQQQASFRT
jgi:hypothetical protein